MNHPPCSTNRPRFPFHPFLQTCPVPQLGQFRTSASSTSGIMMGILFSAFSTFRAMTNYPLVPGVLAQVVESFLDLDRIQGRVLVLVLGFLRLQVISFCMSVGLTSLHILLTFHQSWLSYSCLYLLGLILFLVFGREKNLVLLLLPFTSLWLPSAVAIGSRFERISEEVVPVAVLAELYYHRCDLWDLFS